MKFQDSKWHDATVANPLPAVLPQQDLPYSTILQYH